MQTPATPVEERAHVAAVRVAAAMIVIGTLAWEILRWPLSGRHATILLATHLAVMTVGTAAYGLTFRRLSLEALRLLVFLIVLLFAVQTAVVAYLVPGAAWEGTLLCTIAVVTAAGLVPWTAGQQASLAAAAVGVYWVMMLAVWPTDTVPAGVRNRILGVLLLGGITSVIVARQRARSRMALFAADERYRRLFAVAHDATVILDGEGRIRRANAAFGRLCGVNPDLLIGRAIGDHLVLEEASALLPGTTESDGGDSPALTGHVTSVTGSRRDVEADISWVDTAAGPAAQVIIRDVESRRTAERRLAEERRIEALGRISAGLAHQFNNILGSILTNASLLRERLVAEEDTQQMGEIVDAVRRGRTLTRALQRFTADEAISLKATRPREIVDSAAELIRPMVPTGVRFEAGVEESLPTVAADMDHIVQALSELASNSFRVLEGTADPILRLEAARDASGVRFTVRDNGPGMDAATRDRIFDPFYSTRPMFEATGLGMAAVYWVARAHGGLVDVESEPGKGTAVHLTIPFSVAEARSSRAQARQSTVLIVDDEQAIRDPIARALDRMGYRTLKAADGREAVASARENPEAVDIVLLDVVLPGGGLGLMKELMRLVPRARIILSTGYAPEGEAARMLAEGAHGFLQKPYEFKELQTEIESQLAESVPAREA